MTWEDYYRQQIAEKKAEIAKTDDLTARVGKAAYDESFRAFCMKSKAASAKHQAASNLLTEANHAIYNLRSSIRSEIIDLEEKLKRLGCAAEA